MAKSKKNKGGTKGKAKSAKSRNLKSKQPRGNVPQVPTKVNNPFEIRVNRAKHDNLGRRGKHEKGVPGISRGEAIEKRKETLLKEYKIRNKSSILVDKRIGEKIKNMSEEEKIIRRSVVEKQRQYKQKSIFNLPSTDDMLTHKGQVLMDIDRYEDPREGSDSEDERLNEEFVSDAHFAGDFLKIKPKSADSIDEDEGKTRGDIIAELILNSKKRKMEKAKEADENYELVTKLDEEFKTPDFRNLLTFVKKDNVDTKNVAPPKKEDYDKIVRELHFESKTGQASNKLKTEEEIQEDELQKLQKLEKDRMRRMQAQDPSVPRHRSADELADEFEMTDEIPTLSYQKNGKLNQLEEDEEEDNSSDEEKGEEEEDVEEEESEDDDAYSDLESENEESKKDIKSKSQIKTKKTGILSNQGEDTTSIAENDDIPYTFSFPKTYESFVKLFKKYQALINDDGKCVFRFRVVLERLVKYSLLADKSRLPNLFVYLLQFIIEGIQASMSISENTKKIIGISVVSLHSILLTDPTKCVEMMEIGIARHLFQAPESEKSNRLILSKVAFYQICSQLFCVTDFCHRVLSPLKVDMLNIINSYTISTYSDLLKVLAITDIVHTLSQESKRYCPEIVKLLIDILDAISLPTEKLRLKRRRFEFLRQINSDKDETSRTDHSVLLEICNKPPTFGQVKNVLLRVFDFANSIIQATHRTKAFNNLIYALMKAEHQVLCMNWEDKNFHEELFLKKLPTDIILPQENTAEDELPTAPIDRPKMLKMYEPMIEENFDGNKKRKQKRKGMTQEEARLNHKVKKEMKSAVREILKDNAFLAKQQLKEQATKDAERSRRVKELLGSLSNQEGDYRKLKKHV